MNNEINILPEYLQVEELLKNNQQFIFTTGGAGTGKSVFIKWIKQKFNNSCLLCAPTALAAINIGGVTIHSLCKFPPRWIVDDDIKKNSKTSSLLKKIKFLIIDEISMVNANLFDAMDKFFRINLNKTLPFGGLSVILVGDLFQLPPVVRFDTRNLFNNIYDSEYFFSASSFDINSCKVINLSRVFRQQDTTFIKILNNIRIGNNIPEAISYINNNCEITNYKDNFVVWLSPTNNNVDYINQSKLNNISNPPYAYVGKINGRFKEDRLPSPMQLTLKVGSQVMFVQNDKDKKWINGDIGIVDKLDRLFILVRMMKNNKETLVKVFPTQWDDYEYDIEDDKIKIKKIGTYTQYPLILAWALTIHKSQGKTIENIHLDFQKGRVFAPGQSYVALSRCTAIKGISLTQKLIASDIKVDFRVLDFYKKLSLV